MENSPRIDRLRHMFKYILNQSFKLNSKSENDDCNVSPFGGYLHTNGDVVLFFKYKNQCVWGSNVKEMLIEAYSSIFEIYGFTTTPQFSFFLITKNDLNKTIDEIKNFYNNVNEKVDNLLVMYKEGDEVIEVIPQINEQVESKDQDIQEKIDGIQSLLEKLYIGKTFYKKQQSAKILDAVCLTLNLDKFPNLTIETGYHIYFLYEGSSEVLRPIRADVLDMFLPDICIGFHVDRAGREFWEGLTMPSKEAYQLPTNFTPKI